jgi:hypothetical protein
MKYANHSEFVKIVIFVSFFETHYFVVAPRRNGQKNIAQLKRNFAPFGAQFEQVVHFAKIHQQRCLVFWRAT